jgi:hypothetical protein
MTEQQVSTKRADHAALISAALVKGVEAAIEAGHRLAIAQAELLRPDFLAMLHEDLHITEGTASKLKAIASHPVLSELSHGKVLPPNWSVLYALTQVPQADLISAIESGDIHPDMERKDVKALLPPPEPEQRDDDLPADYEGSAEPDYAHEVEAQSEHIAELEAAREHDGDLAEQLRRAAIEIVGLKSEIDELRAECDQLRARIIELESASTTPGTVTEQDEAMTPKRRRGRPPGSTNKPKSPPAENTAAPPQRGEDNAPAPEVGAEIMKAKMAALDDGLDIPDSLRREPKAAAS